MAIPRKIPLRENCHCQKDTKILWRRLYFHPNDLFVHDFQCQGTTATCGRWGIAHIDQCLADFGGSQRKVQELLLVTESTCQYHDLICFWNKSHLKDVDKADTSGALARVNLRRYHYLIFASRWNKPWCRRQNRNTSWRLKTCPSQPVFYFHVIWPNFFWNNSVTP